MTIKEIAFSYIGKKELPGNSGFEDKDFENEMLTMTGWRKSYAWCICFCWLVWKKSMPAWVDFIDKMFSVSVMKTWNNFKNTDYVSKTPMVGSVVIWQKYSKGKPTGFGHAGIVTEIYAKSFATIEGNTNALGSREGDRVAPKMRQLDFSIKEGLVLKGFLLPLVEIVK